MIQSPKYRPDIDGLRAIAVVAVIIFHLGWLPYGYLGVDIFFVISGFLITGIIAREIRQGQFTARDFYLRRIRRILPLVSFIAVVALMIGIFTMLPDDLENLAQSVVATNLFSNNILQAITTRNYWDVVNEYKPLMHTWSLGVEEQYYLIYPLLFVALGARRIKLIIAIIAALAVFSLALFLAESVEHHRFYFLQYRFFELAAGGLLALALKDSLVPWRLGIIWVVLLVALLVVEVPGLPSEARLLLVLIVTLGVLASDTGSDRLASALLTNRLVVYLGLTSFSLYMWHHLVFAYTRYFVAPVITPVVALMAAGLTVILAELTYRYIETPFRDKRRTSARTVLVVVAVVSTLTTLAGLFLHTRAGIIRDVPELEITVAERRGGLHSEYNARVYEANRPFSGEDKVRVLVIGNSFARDWANVLLESRHAEYIELSYVPELSADAVQRAGVADVVYVSTADHDFVAGAGLEMDRVWSVGTKSFGENNGYFFNRRGSRYCMQRAVLAPQVIESNRLLAQPFGERYIDLMALVADADGTVPVFTPACLFISQDTRHFTRAGAAYFADLLDPEITKQLGLLVTSDETVSEYDH